jgi:hypothetical protein
MNMSMLRFQWLKFTRSTIGLLGIPAALPVVVAFTQRLPWNSMATSPWPLAFSLLFGCSIGMSQEERRGARMGSDAPHLLSRTGTRVDLVMARWAFYLMLGTALLAVITLGALHLGILSSHAEATMPWPLLPRWEKAGYSPVFSPSERVEYARWLSQGQPATHRFAVVILPWLGAPFVACSFVCFLLGAMSGGVLGPPRSRWPLQRLLEPRVWASLAPYAAAALCLILPAFASSPPDWGNRFALLLYVHAWLGIIVAPALLAFYGWITLRGWNRADV